MAKEFKIIKPAHGYYKGECLSAEIAPTIDTGVGCWHTLIGESNGGNQVQPDRQADRREVGQATRHEPQGLRNRWAVADATHRGGGNTEPKILIPEPTQKGYGIATYGDSINMAFPNSKTRRGRVGHGVAQTLTAQDAQQAVIEPIIFDDYNGRIRADQECVETLTTNCGNDAPRNGVKIIEPIAYDEQNGYARQDGTVGTLTTDGNSPKHNNRIVEPNYRIRKLTERECFRLMGVKSEDFEKVRYGAALPKGSSEKIAKRTMTKDEWRVCWRIMRHDRQSVSSCYHLAGDSIVTACLMAIFGLLLEVDYKQKIAELTEELKEK